MTRDFEIEYANQVARGQLQLSLGAFLTQVLAGDGWPNWTNLGEFVRDQGTFYGDAQDASGQGLRIMMRRRKNDGYLIELRRASTPSADMSSADTSSDETSFEKELAPHYSQIFDWAEIGLWRSDATTDQIWSSKATYRLVNHAPGPMTLESYFSHVPPEDQAKIAEEMNATVVNDERYLPHFRVIDSAGKTRHLKSVGKAVRNEKGICTSYLGIVTDETEIVEARSRITTLEYALERAQRLTLAGQLSMGVAHDLNNVLTAVMGHADLLTDETGRERTAPGETEPLVNESAKEIMAAASHASDLGGRS